MTNIEKPREVPEAILARFVDSPDEQSVFWDIYNINGELIKSIKTTSNNNEARGDY